MAAAMALLKAANHTTTQSKDGWYRFDKVMGHLGYAVYCRNKSWCSEHRDVVLRFAMH
jgi:hypothetical protein